MKYSTNTTRIKRKTLIHLIVSFIALTIVTPALADYLGPNRTVTESTSVCKVVLYECQYVTSKDSWKYHKVNNWSCSNESKPWKSYSSNPSSQGCLDATAGDKYWSKEETLQEVTITHPPATIDNSLQNCNSFNGWCNTAPELVLSGTEPLSGYDILAIEGSLNRQSFACSGSNCSVPLNEGNNDLTFWALSSWGDSSEMGIFSSKVDTIPPTLGFNISASTGTNGWYVSQATVTATGSDSTSGLSSVLLSVNNGLWESSATLDEGIHNIDVQAEDNAGNTSSTSSIISIDTTTPSIDLSLDGSIGKNGWYISNIEIAASATDLTSGVETLEVSNDGDAYTNYNSPITFIDGEHTVQFKATDRAGNVIEIPKQEFQIDTLAPVVTLPASWEVNETITYEVQDDLSGLSELRVVIEDDSEKYAKVVWEKEVTGTKFTDEITWDGKFADNTVAPPGEYHVWIKTSDNAGNNNYMLGIVTVPSPTIPSPSAPSPSAPSPKVPTVTNSSPLSRVQIVPVAVPPSVTIKPPKELFDGEAISIDGSSSPKISFGGTAPQIKEVESKSISVSPPIPSTTPPANSNLLWGTAAASMVSAVALYAYEEQRKREEEAARKRAEIKARIAKQNAQKEAANLARKTAEWLEGQAILNAQVEVAKTEGATKEQISALKKIVGEKGLGAAIKRSVTLTKNLGYAAVQTARLKSKMLRYQAEDEAAWQRAEQIKAQQAAEKQKALEDWRTGEKAEFVVSPPEKSWWEKAKEKQELWLSNVWDSAYKHQTELSLGTGIVVGAAAVLGVVAGVITAPAWLVVGGAVLATAALVTAGTMAINAHFDLPTGNNLGSNLIAGIVTTVIVTGAGLLLVNAAPWVTTTIASTCTKYPTACTQIGPIIDHGEELLLTTQLGYYNWIGDQDKAALTIVQLQLEQMDGGVPGNSLALEASEELTKLGPDAVEIFAKYGDDVIPLLSKNGDDAVDIIGAYGDEGIALFLKFGDQADEVISLVKNHGDSAIRLLNLKAADIASAEKLLTTLDNDVLDYAMDQGPDAVAALSRWSENELMEYGPELALRANKDAEVLRDIKTLISSGPMDPKNLTSEQQVLINAIAKNSMQYNDEGQIVLGKWVDYGNGFTSYARETGSVHYNPHPDMWNLLGELGKENRDEAAWLVNKQVIQSGIDIGMPFEYTLEGISTKDIPLEQSAVQMIFSGETDTEIMQVLGLNNIPIRMKELRELHNASYAVVFDEVSHTFILSPP